MMIIMVVVVVEFGVFGAISLIVSLDATARLSVYRLSKNSCGGMDGAEPCRVGTEVRAIQAIL